MQPKPSPSGPQTIDARSTKGLATLLENARALHRVTDADGRRWQLRGKKYGLLCDAGTPGEDAVLFECAALELGAQVAHIRPALTESTSLQTVQQTAHMLGRLYDALLCDGVDSGVVERLRAEAGVPVYDRITSPDHPIAMVADMLGIATSIEGRRRLVLQAMLLRAAD